MSCNHRPLVGVLCVTLAAVAAMAQSPRFAEIRLMNRTIDEGDAATFSSSSLDKCEDEGLDPVHVLLQFAELPDLARHESLVEEGVNLLGYVCDNAYVATVPCGFLLPNEARLFEIELTDKLSPSLDLSPWAVDGQRVKAVIQLHRDADVDGFDDELTNLGVRGERYGPTTWKVQTSRQKLREIAALDEVKLVQPGPWPPAKQSETSRAVVRAEGVQRLSVSASGPVFALSGEGIRIGVSDSGVDRRHQDFDKGVDDGGGRVSRVCWNDNGTGWHGTHVASIAAGNGGKSASNDLAPYSRRGLAPEAQIGDYPLVASSLELAADMLVEDCMDLSNHSYAMEYVDVYDAEFHDIDLMIRGEATDEAGRDLPARVQVWAAGNYGRTDHTDGNRTGYYSLRMLAKNTITVGAIDSIDGRLYQNSSLGPTTDGRSKPDLVAPGCRDGYLGDGILAAMSNSESYVGNCGTSMAAPVVSGTIALMMEAFVEAHGVKRHLLPATYRAAVVNATRDLVKTEPYGDDREFENPDTNEPLLYHAGPDFVTGHGLLETDAAIEAMRSGAWREGRIASADDMDLFCLEIPEGQERLKVTLAWDDEPGETICEADCERLVNDLDLVLHGPEEVRGPWRLQPLPVADDNTLKAQDVQPATLDGEDHLNNLEQVNVYYPQPGRWWVQVIGNELKLGNSQSYAVTASRPLRSCRELPNGFSDPAAESCERVLCSEFPSLCSAETSEVPLERVDVWTVAPQQRLPIHHACSAQLDCPPCDTEPWEECPGWELTLEGVPAETDIVLFDEHGCIVLTDKEVTPLRTLEIPGLSHGDRLFAIFAADGSPLGESIDISATTDWPGKPDPPACSAAKCGVTEEGSSSNSNSVDSEP